MKDIQSVRRFRRLCAVVIVLLFLAYCLIFSRGGNIEGIVVDEEGEEEHSRSSSSLSVSEKKRSTKTTTAFPLSSPSSSFYYHGLGPFSSECADKNRNDRTVTYFEKKIEDWIDIHNSIMQNTNKKKNNNNNNDNNANENKFVHVGILHKSSLFNNIKVIVSALSLAIISKRALIISWTQIYDVESTYRTRMHMNDLFEIPAKFNWTYDYDSFRDDDLDRYNVTGFGLEQYVELEPLHVLLCDDYVYEEDNYYAKSKFWEVPWRYGFFAPLLYHNRHLHEEFRSLFLSSEDLFGPLFRLFFKPVKRIWTKIVHFYEIHMKKKEGGEKWGEVYGIDVTRKPKEAEKFIDELVLSPSFRSRNGRVFVMGNDERTMTRTFIDKFGRKSWFLYYPHRNFTERGDDGELIDLFLLSLCDVVYTDRYEEEEEDY